MTVDDADELAYFYDIATRTRWAIFHNDGRPNHAWSTGEKFAVALVLDRIDCINAMGYDRSDAISRLAGDIGGSFADAETWVLRVRKEASH